jgi:MFS family permease
VATRSIWAARVVVFVAFLDLFLQFPVVPPFAKSLGASDLLVGLIVGIYSATNLLGNIGSGWLLDRLGRRRPVLLGLLASGLALSGYALVVTAEQLLIVRAVHGLATAVLTPGAFAMLGDVATVDRRARVMGVSGAIIAVAAISGPPLGGLLRDRSGAVTVFVLGAVLMGLATLLFTWLVKGVEPVPFQSPAGGGWPDWRQPRLIAANLVVLAFTVGLGTLVTHLPLLLNGRGEPAARIGLAFTAYAVVAMLVMAGPGYRLSDRLGRLPPLLAGLGLIGLALLLLAAVDGLAGVGLSMALFGLGFGLLFPAATTLVTEATRINERGRAFGLFYAVYSLGVVIGSLLSGLLDEQFGTLTVTPFWAGGLVALAMLGGLLWLLRNWPNGAGRPAG